MQAVVWDLCSLCWSCGFALVILVWDLFSRWCLDVSTDRLFGGVDLWAFVMWGFSVERGLSLLELSL